MGQVLHGIERGIIGALSGSGGGPKGAGMPESELAEAAGLSADQARRGVEWLRHKGLADVSEEASAALSIGPAGRAALQEGGGLPERRLLGLLEKAGGGPVPARDIHAAMGADFGPAMGIAKRGGWAQSGDGGSVLLQPGGASGADKSISALERALGILAEAGERGLAAGQVPAEDADAIDAMRKRPGYVEERAAKSRSIRLTERGAQAAADMAASGAGSAAGAIDVEADVPAALPARIHPLTETVEAVRDAFVALGFTEIAGPHVQPCFWNFDALFTPQDHPAREMHDTFYVAVPKRGIAAVHGPRPSHVAHVRAVAAAHERGWGYRWSQAEARKSVLRTHTTCVTVKHLAENRPRQARVFSLGRVFRNEKASYKHLAEFHQVEGIVVGAEANMRSLMGILQKFYSMIGMQRIRFWPTFFPYTEPSLQAMAYNEGRGKWVELFGMGMLRREVTAPLGMADTPVLAWGGGIERIAMMRHGVDDVRTFYGNDLAWLRGASHCP